MLGGNLTQYQTGNVAAMATMAALLFQEAGGEGTHVDIAAYGHPVGVRQPVHDQSRRLRLHRANVDQELRPPGSPRPTGAADRCCRPVPSLARTAP